MTDTAAIERAEVVPAPQQTPQATALERAAEAAIAMPGLPGRDEFLALAMQARMLSLSGAAPEAVRNNPHLAFHLAMVGRDLGISPTAALALIDVINTSKGPQLSLSPQLLNGQIRRLGLGSIRPLVQERDRCVAGAYDPHGNLLGETEFTWADAIDAGLVMPDCQPGAHSPKCLNHQSKSWERCNQGYRTYPRRMMWWRASGFAANDWFPEAGLGLYSPEELGAVVDDDGRPIDPAQVALPEGYTDPGEAKREREAEREAAASRPADGADLWELQASIKALPDAVRAGLQDQWKAEGSRLRGKVARFLTPTELRTARAMVNAHWAQAVKDGANKAADIEATHGAVYAAVAGFVMWVWAGAAAVAPPAPPEAPLAPDTHPEAPQAADGDDGGQPAPASPAPEADTAEALAARAEKQRWMRLARDTAEQVRAALGDCTEAEVEALAERVKGFHHTYVNGGLARSGMAEVYPPECPMELRRMACTLAIVTGQWVDIDPESATTTEADDQ